MLTILWKTIHDQEITFQAKTVLKGTFCQGKNKGKPYCEFLNDPNEPMPFPGHLVEFGNVYVMNEKGQTVAHHHLGGFELADQPTIEP